MRKRKQRHQVKRRKIKGKNSKIIVYHGDKNSVLIDKSI